MYNKSILFALCVLSLISPANSQTDWQEFFPLHVGDYWVYHEKWNVMPMIYTERVVSQDTLENGRVYAKVNSFLYGMNGQGTIFTRVDSLGDVYEYDKFNKNENLIYKLNVFVGYSWLAFPDRDLYWVVEDKRDLISADNDTLISITLTLCCGIAFQKIYIQEGFGVTFIQGELFERNLHGVFINGRLYGDTTVTKLTIEQDEALPEEISLAQNYPNPFNQFTRISYKIRKGGAVYLAIYDMGGRVVKQLVNNEQPAGESTVIWDGTDDSGSAVVTGMYLIRLQADDRQMTRKILYLK